MFELLVVLDRSGSMLSNETDVIGGYNNFIKDQKKEGMDKLVTLILFDNQYETVYESLPISKVPELTSEVYSVRGTTALLDSIGRTIEDAGARFDTAKQKPAGVVMFIYTDGLENASHRYSASKICELIKQQTNDWNWEFIFYGAGIDAFTQSRQIGISDINVIQTTKRTEDYTKGFATVADKTTSYAAKNR